MLMLTRRNQERIRLLTTDGEIWLTVAKIERGKVAIGIDAPQSVEIAREELIEDDEKLAGGLGGEHV